MNIVIYSHSCTSCVHSDSCIPGVQVNDIPGHTHYLYYEGNQLIALVT